MKWEEGAEASVPERSDHGDICGRVLFFFPPVNERDQ